MAPYGLMLWLGFLKMITKEVCFCAEEGVLLMHNHQNVLIKELTLLRLQTFVSKRETRIAHFSANSNFLRVKVGLVRIAVCIRYTLMPTPFYVIFFSFFWVHYIMNSSPFIFCKIIWESKDTEQKFVMLSQCKKKCWTFLL